MNTSREQTKPWNIKYIFKKVLYFQLNGTYIQPVMYRSRAVWKVRSEESNEQFMNSFVIRWPIFYCTMNVKVTMNGGECRMCAD